MPSLKEGWLVDNNCGCCPYGFHIDRDFVNFSKKMLGRDRDVERLKELREKCRKEQTTLLGILGKPTWTNKPDLDYQSLYKGILNISVFENARKNLPKTPEFDMEEDLRRMERLTKSRRLMIDATLQVDPMDFDDRDFSMPVLQIIEKVDAFSQADPEPSMPQLTKKMRTCGISASPKTAETGVSAKPTVVNTATSTERSWKAQTRNFGVTVSLPLSPSEKNEQKQEEPKREMRTFGTNTERTRLTNVGVGTTRPSRGRSIETQTESRKTTNVEAQTTNSISREFSSQTDEVKEKVSKDNQDDKCAESKISLGSKMKSPTGISTGGNKRAWSPVNKQGPKPGRWGETPELDSNAKSNGSRIPRLNLRRSPRQATPSEGEVPYEHHSTLQGFSNPTRPPFNRSNTYTVEEEDETSDRSSVLSMAVLVEEEAFEEETRKENEAFRFFQTPPPREKILPSKELQGAMKVLNDAILVGKGNGKVSAAVSLIMREWFSICGTSQADPHMVEDYIDYMEGISDSLLRYVINMPDGNGNTVLHYSVSHGNFDVVSVILNSNACNPNKSNKAGYTPLMLVALAKMSVLSHKNVVRRLFELGDVNIKAKQHGQTALMLAASHGRIDTVKQLIEAEAEVDIQDEDGSTALMCATEHGHGDIVKFLLDHSNCDPHLTDNDGTNALGVAMEAGHKDIGVMIYAHMYFKQGGKPRVDQGDASPGSAIMEVDETSEPTPPQKLSPQEDKTAEATGPNSA